MSVIEAGNGVCVGYGATNARFANVADTGIVNFPKEDTPKDPNEFFRQMSGWIVDAHDSGSKWMVAGFPGPVTRDGKIVGPMQNVQGMDETEYAIVEELEKARPGVRKILDKEFKLICVNDGELAAQAVAERVADLDADNEKVNKDKVAALIIGTGVGLGIVIKDPRFTNVFRADSEQPLELGHETIDIRPYATHRQRVITWESFLAGPALAQQFGAKDLVGLSNKGGKNEADRAEYRAYDTLARGIVMMATNLGPRHDVTLVAPTGGVGAGASAKYRKHFDTYLKIWDEGKDNVQAKYTPKIELIDPAEADIFEMYGAVGVMRAHKTESGLHLPVTFTSRQQAGGFVHDY